MKLCKISIHKYVKLYMAELGSFDGETIEIDVYTSYQTCANCGKIRKRVQTPIGLINNPLGPVQQEIIQRKIESGLYYTGKKF